MAKHGYDIAGALAKQKELVNKGYKLAIDEDWGKRSCLVGLSKIVETIGCR